ncbi:MAG: L-lactate permease [Candidatus Woesearchaeota archaeon]
MIIVALIPFLLLIFLLIILKWPAIKAMPLVLFSTILLIIYWGVQTTVIAAATTRALILFLELFLLIFFAVALLQIMIKSGRIQIIEQYLASITTDVRIQAMLIAWAFVALIEGAAGFGTPVALAAPFLVALGFPMVTAIAIGLIGDSTAVTFGAAGTPVIVGLSSSGLSMQEITQSTTIAAGLHLILAIIATLFISYIVSKKGFKEFIPFAILSAFAFTIPYYLTAVFIGPELPSIIGGLAAILIISLAAKHNFLTPKQTISFKQTKKVNHSFKKVIWAITPFIILITTLVASRTIPFLKELLQKPSIGITNILATQISQELLITYTPGFFFLLTIILISSKQKINSLKESFEKIKLPMITLLMILIMTQLILYSNININDFQGIPQTIASYLSNLLGSSFILISPFIASFGAFITGSSTVSNLLFSSIQVDAALTIGASTVMLASLQLVGSAAGNMIALHNVVTASATLGLKKGEGEIIKKTLLPSLLYCLIAGLIIFLII